MRCTQLTTRVSRDARLRRRKLNVIPQECQRVELFPKCHAKRHSQKREESNFRKTKQKSFTGSLLFGQVGTASGSIGEAFCLVR